MSRMQAVQAAVSGSTPPPAPSETSTKEAVKLRQRKPCVNDLPKLADAVVYFFSIAVCILASLQLAHEYTTPFKTWIVVYAVGGCFSMTFMATTLAFGKFSHQTNNLYAGMKEQITLHYFKPTIEEKVKIAHDAGYHGARFVRYTTATVMYYIGFTQLMFILFYTKQQTAAINELDKGFRGYQVMSLVEQQYLIFMFIGVIQLPIQVCYLASAACNACGFHYISG